MHPPWQENAPPSLKRGAFVSKLVSVFKEQPPFRFIRMAAVLHSNIAVFIYLCYILVRNEVTILANKETQFDELMFFAQVKKRPGAFLGKPSLLSLRDQLFGMDYAFSFSSPESPLSYFKRFVKWYHEEIIKDANGYACWWNHILYTSGNNDAYAFESFFRIFEGYLQDKHNVFLPDLT